MTTTATNTNIRDGFGYGENLATMISIEDEQKRMMMILKPKMRKKTTFVTRFSSASMCHVLIQRVFNSFYSQTLP